MDTYNFFINLFLFGIGLLFLVLLQELREFDHTVLQFEVLRAQVGLLITELILLTICNG